MPKTVRQEAPHLALLFGFYTIQGISDGIKGISLGIIYKKYMSYTQLGILQYANLASTFRIVYAPFVENYRLP